MLTGTGPPAMHARTHAGLAAVGRCWWLVLAPLASGSSSAGASLWRRRPGLALHGLLGPALALLLFLGSLSPFTRGVSAEFVRTFLAPPP
jgi:hypothetical protein